MKYFLTLLFSISIFAAYAQRSCGTMELYQAASQQNPQLIQNRVQIENQIQSWISTQSNSGSRSIISIPVVVHVVYKTAGENISDSQVQSQIDVLNEDYSRTNLDASQTPSMFQGVASNCEIQFCLAQRDPDNQPTNGITRTQTLASSFPLGASVKHSNTGGKDAWPSDKYLNIWVCNLVNPVIGFATLPGTTSPDEDGVVIIYKHFGRIGNVEAPYNKGRTATHEIGHWLNLLHTWGDDESSSDPCAGSDQVNDTPNQGGPNFGCPAAGTASCSNGGDMFMNYMDYTDDNCMNLFTEGQKNRMIATLNGIRSTIPVSNGCITPPIIQDCDTLNNITGGDGLVYYYSYEIVETDSGFFTGTNSRNDLAFAEAHSVVGQHTVDAIRFDFAYAVDGSGTSNVHVGIWEDDGTNPPGSPGTLVGEAFYPLAQVENNVDNFTFTDVAIAGSPLVDGTFYVGFFTSDLAEDTIAVYSNQIDKVNVNTAWLQDQDGQWDTFSSAETFGNALSIAARPVVCETVGISEPLVNQLKLYPNPSTGKLNVQLPNYSVSQAWQVFAMDGSLVQEGKSSSNTITVDLTNATDGIYLFRTVQGKDILSSRISVIR